MASRPLTQADRDQVRALHAQGLGRNAIAAQIGRSASTVSKLAKAAGLTFDRRTTKQATAARIADARSRRSELMLTFLDDAARLRAQIWQPHEYIDHGGKDFDEARWTQPEPSPADKRHLMQAASLAVDRSLKLDLHDKDTGADEIGSLLGGLFDRLRDRHGPGD